MKGYAAVAVISTRTDKILFIKRRVNPNDPWSGDIAFPGGKKISEDMDLLETVYREVDEEVGINLKDLDTFPIVLGVFSPMSFPEFKVYAYNFWINDEIPVDLGYEIDSSYWIKLKVLRRGRCLRLVRPRNELLEVDCFRANELIIWGLTYRILDKFLGTFKVL